MSEARSYLLPCNIFMVASLREPKAFARELGIFSTTNSSASRVVAYVSRPRTALRCSNHAIRELCRSPEHGAACRTGKEIDGSKRRPCCTHLDYVLSFRTGFNFGFFATTTSFFVSTERSAFRNAQLPLDENSFQRSRYKWRMVTRKTGILKSDENATTLRAAPRECIVAKGCSLTSD